MQAWSLLRTDGLDINRATREANEKEASHVDAYATHGKARRIKLKIAGLFAA